MLPSLEPACLVIADISGYTGYVTGVELDHAQDILADLIHRLVKTLRPPFKLAKLEGDAAFAYVMTDKIDGSLLQDSIESTYFTFRRRLRDIGRATSCECDACRRIPQLDLKFVVHHGEVAKQRMAGRDELAGRDVILIHRLLKNSVDSKLGGRAYALYTDACIKVAGIDPMVQGLIEHSETIDVIGEVRVWLKDLHAAWQEEERRKRTELTAAAASLVMSYDISVPRQLVWEYATLPSRRTQWVGADAVLENAPKGRRGAGAINHCMHGKDTIIEEVLDWRPYDYMTSRYTMPMPGSPRMLETVALTELPNGRVHLEMRVGPATPKEKAAFDQMLPMVEPMLRANSDTLVCLLEKAAADYGVAGDGLPLPISSGRFRDAATSEKGSP
jgi:uncharacterized protein YndB with AHSA1/START domain